MASIAIILLNYNATRLTKTCVRSLQATKDPEDTYHIIIWDNASTVPPKPQEFPGCDCQLSSVNMGFAAGNNAAVAYATNQYHPEYIFILNNDTRVAKGTIRTLISALRTDAQIGITVPKIYFERGCEFHPGYSQEQRGKVIWYGGGQIDWPNVLAFHTYVDEVDRGHVVGGTTEFATGCAMMMATSTWKQLKGFDPAYFLYYEDTDLSMRLLQRGYRIEVIPDAVVYHRNAGSTQGSGSALHTYYQTRNRIRFALWYAPLRAKYAVLKEARRYFYHGTPAQRLAVLHALGGRWGNQSMHIQ